MVRTAGVAKTTLIGIALGLAFVRLPAPWIERWYSNGAYPAIDRAVRNVTAPVPFCVGDALAVLLGLGLTVYWAGALAPRRNAEFPGARGRRALGALVGTAVILAAIFVWFEVGWALNYSRIPVSQRLALRAEAATGGMLDAFADHVVDELSRAATPAHREHAALVRLGDGAFVGRLEASFEATIRRLGDRDAFAPPRVKATIFQPFFAMSGTTGFTDPWTHEVNLDSGAFFYERPAFYAHEWGHISGFTSEAAANFISAVACTRSRDPWLVYSGWMLVWFNLPAQVHVTHPISRVAYDDIMAVRARFFRRVNRRVADASRVAYNQYLKSNGVRSGYANYGEFIAWMLRARFDSAGLPLTKQVAYRKPDRRLAATASLRPLRRAP